MPMAAAITPLIEVRYTELDGLVLPVLFFPPPPADPEDESETAS